ncbi:hypothetical protein CS060_13800 [Anoxybacillus flavithermus]|uniref:HipA-like kinase domain-containing protein n=2 Tax=Anoxybacillus flavithermus TaxID=33934 RepID=A0A2G5RLW8_9BACL|nr:hypothetical protein CS060_13800 [Anoxybacillus flavithermus]
MRFTSLSINIHIIDRKSKKYSAHFMMWLNSYYVLKTKERGRKNYSLINEWVAFNIGKLLDVPIPKAHIIKIDIKDKSSYGLLFDYKLPVDYLHVCHVQNIPVWKFLSKLRNVDTFSNLLVFDIWINNKDRSSNYGNLLVTKKDDSYYYYAIDHALSFGGYYLDNESKILLKKSKICQLNFSSANHPYPFNHVYEAIKLNIEFQGCNPFDDVLNKMSKITESQIEDIFNQVPKNTDWFEQEDIDIYIEYLMRRKNNVILYLEQLIEKMWFPNASPGCYFKLFNKIRG